MSARYNALNQADKSKVTNYDLLESKINEYNKLLGIEEIEYDLYANFPSTSNSYGKESTVTINNIEFYTSNYSTKDGLFLLGSNDTNYEKPDAKYNIGNWNKYSVLEFYTSSLTGISFKAGKSYANLDGCHLLYSSDGLTYELVTDFSITEGDENFYTFTEGKTGYFVLVVEGKQPRLNISDFSLSF